MKTKRKKINKIRELLSCFENMDPKDIEKLAKILRDQGDKLLTSEFKFTVTGNFVAEELRIY